MRSRSRIRGSLAYLGIMYLCAVSAGFLSPYDPEAQHREFPFVPPTRIHFVDAGGRFHLRPFVYRLKERAGSTGTCEEDTATRYPIRFFARPPQTGEAGEQRLRLFGVDPPAELFLLGTDGFGRDQLSRLLYGGRISLFSGLLAGGLALGLGLLLGSIAGFYGRWLDETVMRGAELLLALPWLYCLLAFRAFLPLSISAGQAFLLLVLVIGLRGWARPARLIRGVVLSAKERDFVLAARSCGASEARVLCRHVLPQTFGTVLTQAALLIPQFVLAEVTLSFLGLGVGEPVPSWGNMLSSLQHYNVLASYWWMGLPGLILVAAFLGFYVLANSLREYLRLEGTNH